MITKITYKFNDKSLARYRYKQKQNVWNLWATLVCSTQSPNLVTYSSYFRQVVGLCDRSSRIGCPGEALNLCAKFSKFIFLSVSSLSSSEIETSKVACVALNRRKYENAKPVFLHGKVVTRGRPFLNIRIHLTFIGWVVRFSTTAYNQVFSYTVINWYNTLCSCTTSIVNSLFENRFEQRK